MQAHGRKINVNEKKKDAIFRQLLDECLEELEPYKLPIAPKENIVIKSSTMRVSWALCEHNTEDEYFSIKVTERLIADGVDRKYAKGTIIHELLHTIDGCMVHNDKWFSYAKRLEIALEYPIVDGISEEQMHNSIPDFARLTYCPYCGSENLLCEQSHILALSRQTILCASCYTQLTDYGKYSEIKKLLGENFMVNLTRRLKAIPDVYDDFILGVLNYAKKKPEHVKKLNDFMDNNKNVTTSDVVEFIMSQPNFHKAQAPQLSL